MLIEWKEEYSVNVKEIDNQHKDFVDLVNRLYTAINEKKIKENIEDIFEELIKFSKYHFSTEEKYFDKFNYEFKGFHKSEHNMFIEKILKLQKQYKDDEITISFELVDFLEDWFLGHLNMVDKQYSKFFNDNGLF